MPFLRPSAVKQTTITTATGTLALIANSGDTRSFQTALGTGPVKCRYMIRGNGYFEMGRGTFTAPSTLARDEIIISSNSDNAVSIPPGTSDVYLLDYFQFQADRFSASKVLTNKDASNTWVFTGSSAASLTLPAQSAMLPDFWGVVKNAGTAILTLTCAGSDTLDDYGLGTLSIQPGESLFIFQDYNAGTGAALRVLWLRRLGIVKLMTLTANNSASLSDTTSLLLPYRDFIYEFTDLVPGTNGVALWARYSTNGGASYDAAANYNYSTQCVTTNSGGTGYAGSLAATLLALSGTATISSSANLALNGKMRMFNPRAASSYKKSTYETVFYDTGSIGYFASGMGGYYGSSSPVNAVQFLLSSGNIASGTINVFGVN